MRLSRANIPLASEDCTHSQAISPSPHYNLAPHFWPGFINLQHFCHSRWRNPVRLSKSGVRASATNDQEGDRPSPTSKTTPSRITKRSKRGRRVEYLARKAEFAQSPRDHQGSAEQDRTQKTA